MNLYQKAQARLHAECSHLFGSWAGRYATRARHTPSVARASVCLSVHPFRPRPHVRARALFRVRTDALHNRHAEHAAHSPFLSSGFPPWPSLIPPLSHDASTHTPKPAQAHTCTLPLFTPSRRATLGLSCRRRPKSTTRSSDASWPGLQPALHSLPNRAGSAPQRVGATPSSE